MKRLLVSAAFTAMLVACFDFEAAFNDCYQQDRCRETDAIAPSIISSTPENRATDVDPATTIKLTFDKPMIPTSVTAALTPNVGLGAPQWSADGTSVTFMPVSNLSFATQYSLHLDGKAADGGRLEGDVLSFTIRAAPQGPTLVSSSPISGANGVPLDAGLTLTFSGAVDPTLFVATTTPAVFLGNPSWTSDKLTVSYPGATPYLPNKTYTVAFGGKGEDGLNIGTPSTPISFETIADVIPPTVQTTNPVGGATDASITLVPSVTFSEEMNSASVLGAISISPDAGCQWSIDTQGKIISCAHPTPFADVTQYTVGVGTSAVDLFGNALQTPFSFKFTTGYAPDVAAPSVVSMSPASGTTGLNPATPVTITFSEAMDPAATQGALAITSPGGITATNISWSVGNDVLTFNLTPLPAENTNVTITIGTGATDASGNALAIAFSGTVKTWRTVTTMITSDAALDSSIVKGNSGVAVQPGASATIGVSNTPSTYRALFSFDMTQIFTNAPIAFLSAQVDAYQEGAILYYNSAAGGPDLNFNPMNPNGVYGPVIAENIEYGATLEANDYYASAIAAGGVTTIAVSNNYAASPAGQVHSSDVLSWFVPQFNQWNGSAASADRYFQFRMRSTVESYPTSGTTYGYVNMRTGEATTQTTTLTVVYRAP